MKLAEAIKQLPVLSPEDFEEHPICRDVVEQAEALTPERGWTIVGWAYTENLPVVRREKYACMFRQRSRKIWFQIPEDEFETLVEDLE